jgi:hypothetical protein
VLAKVQAHSRGDSLPFVGAAANQIAQ